jgi:hypothetical protein
LFQAKMNAADHIDYLKTINQTFHEQIKSADQKAAYIFTFLIALVAWSPEMRAVFTWTRTVPFPSAQWGLCLALVVALAGGLVCVALVLLPRKRNGGVCLYWAAWPHAGERLEHAARRTEPDFIAAEYTANARNLAAICQAKYRYVGYAFRCLAVVILCYVLLMAVG